MWPRRNPGGAFSCSNCWRTFLKTAFAKVEQLLINLKVPGKVARHKPHQRWIVQQSVKIARSGDQVENCCAMGSGGAQIIMADRGQVNFHGSQLCRRDTLILLSASTGIGELRSWCERDQHSHHSKLHAVQG